MVVVEGFQNPNCAADGCNPRSGDHTRIVARAIAGVLTLLCSLVAGCEAEKHSRVDAGPRRDAATHSPEDAGPRRDAATHSPDDAAPDTGTDAATAPDSSKSYWTSCIYEPAQLEASLYRDREQLIAFGSAAMEGEVTGIVIDSGQGVPAGFETILTASEDRYVRLQADDAVWTIVASLIQSFSVDVGDAVTLRYMFIHPGAFPAHARIELFSAGKLAFWYSRNAPPLPEGWSYSWGAEQCRTKSECRLTTRNALVLRGPCSGQAEIPPRRHGEICGYAAFVESTERTLEGMRGLTTCADITFGDQFNLTLVRESASSSGDDAGP